MEGKDAYYLERTERWVEVENRRRWLRRRSSRRSRRRKNSPKRGT